MPRGTWDTPRVPQDFAYGALTLFGMPFQALLLSLSNPTSRSRAYPKAGSTPLASYDIKGLGSSLFARRY